MAALLRWTNTKSSFLGINKSALDILNSNQQQNIVQVSDLIYS